MTPAEFFEAVRTRASGAEFAIVTPAPELFANDSSQVQIAAQAAPRSEDAAAKAKFRGKPARASKGRRR